MSFKDMYKSKISTSYGVVIYTYFNDEINNTKSQLNNLQNSGTSIEKFARERYLLKREGEEVYIFEDTSSKKPTTEEKK